MVSGGSSLPKKKVQLRHSGQAVFFTQVSVKHSAASQVESEDDDSIPSLAESEDDEVSVPGLADSSDDEDDDSDTDSLDGSDDAYETASEFSEVGEVRLESNDIEKEYHTVCVIGPKSRNMLLFDTTATTNLISNPRFVHDIRKSESTIYEVKGVGGAMDVTELASTRHFGDTLFSKESGVNIIALCKVWEAGCSVEIDNEKHCVDLTTADGTSLHFTLIEGGLLGTYINHEKILVSSVQENERAYPKRVLEQIKQVPVTRGRINHVSDQELALMINSGSMKNIPISVGDLRVHRDIHGKSKATVRGKTRLQTPLEREKEPKDIYSRRVEFHVDPAYFLDNLFLLGVIKPQDYTVITDIDGSRQAEKIKRGIEEMFAFAASHDCKPDWLYCDPEKAVAKIKPYLQLTYPGLKVDITGVGQHEPVVENRAGQVRRRLKATIATLPYPVPLMFLFSMLLFIVTRLNLVPRSTVYAAVYPQEALTFQKPDFLKDCRAEFFQYVEAEIPEGSTGQARRLANTEPALMLYPANNLQHSWYVYSYNKG